MAEGQDARTFNVPQASPPAKKHRTDDQKPRPDVTARATQVITGNVHGLPPMLSPTLPASIEEQLTKFREGKLLHTKETEANASATAKKTRTVTNEPVADNPKTELGTESRSIGTGQSQAGVATKQTDAAQSRKITSVKPKAQTSKDSNSDSKGEAVRSKPTETKVLKAAPIGVKHTDKVNGSTAIEGKHTHDKKKTLIVTLKISKGLRKDCQRILRMQPRPKKLPAMSQTPTPAARQETSRERSKSNGAEVHQRQQKKTAGEDDSRGKGVALSKPKPVVPASATPKSGEKRRQPDDDRDLSQPSSKRQKPSSVDLKRPHTPVGSALRSPNIPQNASAQKSQLSTPKQALKSAAMYRMGSAEGDVRTPLGSVRGITPIAPGSTERSQPQDPRSSSNAAFMIGAASVDANDDAAGFYKAEFTKYAEMARSLKRAADGLAKLPDKQINTDSVARREGLAIAIETTLCYMLAFTLKDEAARIKRLCGDRTAWVSLLPYFKFLKSVIRETESKRLQGLFYQLEAVCRDTIQQHDDERLERENTTSEEHQQMAENRRLGRRAWIKGRRLLTIDNLQEDFPKTWNKRSKTEQIEEMDPKHYGEGGYCLPLCITTTPIEAVRVGWSFLDEWTKKAGVKWEGKMGL
ncbi:MAG: hypothetical protein Q9201_004317 [Fulgogasparrea decipioides]